MSELLVACEDALLERLDFHLVPRNRRIHEGPDVKPSGHRLDVRDAVGREREDFQMVDAWQPIYFIGDLMDLPERVQIEDIALLHLQHQNQGLFAPEPVEML